MLSFTRGNSCGGALERVAWATLRRCTREDGGHYERIRSCRKIERSKANRKGECVRVEWWLACLLVVMLEHELTRARLPAPAKTGACEATTTAAAASWSCLNGVSDHQERLTRTTFPHSLTFVRRL